MTRYLRRDERIEEPTDSQVECVNAVALPTGRRLSTSFTAPPQHQGLYLIPGVVKPSAGYGP
jgi:hypothetical protein